MVLKVLASLFVQAIHLRKDILYRSLAGADKHVEAYEITYSKGVSLKRYHDQLTVSNETVLLGLLTICKTGIR